MWQLDERMEQLSELRQVIDEMQTTFSNDARQKQGLLEQSQAQVKQLEEKLARSKGTSMDALEQSKVQLLENVLSPPPSSASPHPAPVAHAAHSPPSSAPASPSPSSSCSPTKRVGVGKEMVAGASECPNIHLDMLGKTLHVAVFRFEHYPSAHPQ